jgi:mannose PTS system EIIC component
LILEIIMVSVIGGILCLDRVVVQVMISRPIVTAPIIGLVLGEAYAGLVIGAFIELFWIDRLPIGGYIPPNDTITAILITASSVQSGHYLGNLSQELMILAILIFLPFGILARRIDVLLCQGNEALSEKALADAAKGNARSIARKHLTAILKAYLFPTALILATLPIGIAVMVWAYPRLPDWTVRGLALIYRLLPLIGAAVALSTIRVRGPVPVFCAVFLAVTILIHYFRDI